MHHMTEDRCTLAAVFDASRMATAFEWQPSPLNLVAVIEQLGGGIPTTTAQHVQGTWLDRYRPLPSRGLQLRRRQVETPHSGGIRLNGALNRFNLIRS